MFDENSPWPDGYSGAMSLTFDDGQESQLRKAIPILDNLGLKGTFFLCPRGEDWMNALSPWREVFKNGHEIGNHTISHACSQSLSPRGRLCPLAPEELPANPNVIQRFNGLFPQQALGPVDQNDD